MTQPEEEKPHFLGEIWMLAQRGRQAWDLVSRPEKLALASASVVMMVTSIGGAVAAILLGTLVDRIKEGLDKGLERSELYQAAGEILAAIALVYLLRELLHVLRRSLVENTCTRINRDMQTRVVGHVLKADMRRLSQERVGAQHGKIFRSVDGLVRFVRLMFLDFLPAIFTGLFALGAATTKQPLLGLLMLGVVPFAVLLTIRQLISQKHVRLALMRDCEEIDGAVVEQLSGAEYIRVANTYPLEMERLAKATERRRQREIHHHFMMSLYGCGKALNEGLFHIIVLGLATYLAINGQITFGDILTFSVLYLSVMTPLNEIHRVLDEGHESSLRVGDLVEMLREPEDRSFTTNSQSSPRLAIRHPALRLENLGVEYVTPQGKSKRALDGISLEIKHGETIGIAGRSGCGKSTLIKVLLRLVHADQGQAWIGDLPLHELGREQIANHIGYLGQEPFVFSGTIADNVAYGNGAATPEQIEQAAKLAYLDQEIQQMPGGFGAAVRERGNNLSGGQRQRLAIARVLLKRPPILILDEATSALDNISERFVQRALGISSFERTTLLVAHRLSTLRDCNRILVFDEGRIVEDGPYDRLLASGGLFARLVASADHGLNGSGSKDDA